MKRPIPVARKGHPKLVACLNENISPNCWEGKGPPSHRILKRRRAATNEIPVAPSATDTVSTWYSAVMKNKRLKQFTIPVPCMGMLKIGIGPPRRGSIFP